MAFCLYQERMQVQVRVYGRPDRVCYKCRATKAWLKRHGIEFQFINIDVDPEGEAFVRGLGAQEVPVVVWNYDSATEDSRGWHSGHRIPKLEELRDILADEPDRV